MSDPWDSVAGAESEPEERPAITIDGMEYTAEDAQMLADWFAAPAFALLDRYFDYRRQVSVDFMDSGAMATENTEQMIRESATRGFICSIRAMGPSLMAQIEDAKKAEVE